MKRNIGEDFKAYQRRRKEANAANKLAPKPRMLWQSGSAYVFEKGVHLPIGGGRGTYVKSEHGPL